MVGKGISLENLTKKFITERSSTERAEETLRWYRGRLGKFERWLGATHPDLTIGKVTPDTIRNFLMYLKDGGAKATTRNGYVASLKAFCSYLFDNGYITSNPAQKIKKAKVAKRPIVTLSVDEMLELFAQSRGSKVGKLVGLRDLGLMQLLIDTAARIGELLNLKHQDIDFDQHSVVLFGKAKKPRVVYFGRETRYTLLQYEKVRGGGHRPDDFFFTPRGKQKQLRYRGVHSRLKKYAERAGVTNAAPHKWRRSAATMMHRSGASLLDLQHCLGHSTPTITQDYVGVGSEDMQRLQKQHGVMDGLSLKYSSRK